MQQIIITGVGGQGVLYITRLLAEAALAEGRSVLISETHGMAQRGGNVISHLKVGAPKPAASPEATQAGRSEPAFELSSPLIRPGRADVLLALHPDGLLAHGYYLKADGKIFSSSAGELNRNFIDAARIADELGSPVSANLVLLGFALGSGELFCPPAAVEKQIESTGGKRREINLKAFRAGLEEARKKLSP